MENITECAKLYQTLLNKDYIFTLENNIKIKLYFSADNFYHLMGLEKLIDIEQLKGKQATKIYKQILSGNINDSIIQKSKYYYIIENRIKYFEHITDLFDFISHIFWVLTTAQGLKLWQDQILLKIIKNN